MLDEMSRRSVYGYEYISRYISDWGVRCETCVGAFCFCLAPDHHTTDGQWRGNNGSVVSSQTENSDCFGGNGEYSGRCLPALVSREHTSGLRKKGRRVTCILNCMYPRAPIKEAHRLMYCSPPRQRVKHSSYDDSSAHSRCGDKHHTFVLCGLHLLACPHFMSTR